MCSWLANYLLWSCLECFKMLSSIPSPCPPDASSTNTNPTHQVMTTKKIPLDIAKYVMENNHQSSETLLLGKSPQYSKIVLTKALEAQSPHNTMGTPKNLSC